MACFRINESKLGLRERSRFCVWRKDDPGRKLPRALGSGCRLLPEKSKLGGKEMREMLAQAHAPFLSGAP